MEDKELMIKEILATDRIFIHVYERISDVIPKDHIIHNEIKDIKNKYEKYNILELLEKLLKIDRDRWEAYKAIKNNGK